MKNMENLIAGKLEVGDKFTISKIDGEHEAVVVKKDESGVYYTPPASTEAHQYVLPDGTIAGTGNSKLRRNFAPEGGIPVKGIPNIRIVTRP